MYSNADNLLFAASSFDTVSVVVAPLPVEEGEVDSSTGRSVAESVDVRGVSGASNSVADMADPAELASGAVLVGCLRRRWEIEEELAVTDDTRDAGIAGAAPDDVVDAAVPVAAEGDADSDADAEADETAVSGFKIWDTAR